MRVRLRRAIEKTGWTENELIQHLEQVALAQQLDLNPAAMLTDANRAALWGSTTIYVEGQRVSFQISTPSDVELLEPPALGDPVTIIYGGKQ